MRRLGARNRRHSRHDARRKFPKNTCRIFRACAKVMKAPQQIKGAYKAGSKLSLRQAKQNSENVTPLLSLK